MAERMEILSADLPWDGSDLGVFQAGDLILEREVLDGEEFWKLDSGEHCVARRCLPGRSVLPCLVDEAKPFFGLLKNGTHRATVGKTGYLLTRQLTVEGGVCWEPALDTIPLDHPIRFDRRFCEEVKRIFAMV